MSKSTVTVLENVANRFEQGKWMSGTRGWAGYYCLVGAISAELHHGNQGMSDNKVKEVVRAMGLTNLDQAYHLNDMYGCRAVLDRIYATLDKLTDAPFQNLHKALEGSRIAHAQRDVPLAR